MVVDLAKHSLTKKRIHQTETKPLFVCSRDPNHKIESVYFPDFEEKVYIPREYQEPAVKHICDRYANNHPISGLILSTGAGKSKTTSIAVSQILTDNPKVRAIIAPPQEVIGEAWRHTKDGEISSFLIGEENWACFKALTDQERHNWKSLFPKKDCVTWSPCLDLCQSAGKACASEEGKVKETIKFLTDPAGVEPHSRIAIVTHSTLARVYKELKKAKKLHLLSNLLIVIDEFHHLFVDNSEETCNTLGEMIFYILENRQLNTHICGLTATFFRGDRRRIFAGKFAKLLDGAFYELPFDEYFKYFKYLNKLIYDFGVFSTKESFVKPIASTIRKHGLNKPIFFIPARTKGEDSAFPVSRKKDDVENVLHGILEGVGWKKGIEKKTYTNSDGETVEGVFQLRVGKNKWITVVDAVDDEDHIRKSVKKFLRGVNDGKDSVDVIIALGMCKEGFDWIACDQIILIGNVKSLAMIVQINGRMIRDVAGKSYAVMTWLLPTSTKVDSESMSEDLNQALLSLNLALMMCIDIMQPIMVTAPKRNNPEEKEEISGGDLMSELFETMDKRSEFLAVVTARIAMEGREISLKERIDIVSDILLDLDVDEELVHLYAESVATYTARRASAMKANSVRLSLDFDSPLVRMMAEEFGLVSPEEISPEGLLVSFAAEAIGIDSFKSFRNAVTRISTSHSLERFNNFIDRLDAFVAKNNRNPQKKSSDPEEVSLYEEAYSWKRNQSLLEEKRRLYGE